MFPGLLLVSRRVSSYLHPELHLFAILENSTLRLDCVVLLQASLYLTKHFDRGALNIPGLFDATGFCTVEELVETVKASFVVVGFDFATILSSPQLVKL